ncbi:MAG: hypothetical protein OQL11_05895 [Gammaproteobacteria bacterium]|nr:hypothetical protein [Gammaproteobacteria bacterium]
MPSKDYILGLILMFLVTTAKASVVTFSFSGTITDHGFISSDLHAMIPIGELFSGSYTFNTASLADGDGSINDQGYIGAISDFRVSFGSLYAILDNGGFRLINDKEIIFEPEADPIYEDTYIVQGRTDHASLPTNVDTNIVLSNYQSGGIDSGWHVRWLRLDVSDPSGMLLSDAALRTTAPDISGLSPRLEFGFKLDCCTGTTEVYGTLNNLSVTAVPLPNAATLFVSAIIAAAPAIRRRKYGISEKRCS